MDEKDIEKIIDAPNRTQVPDVIGSDALEDRMQLAADLLAGIKEQPGYAALIHKNPEDNRIEIIKLGESTVIGRSSGADYTIDDDYVSRKHFEVTLTGEGADLKDLESVNGLKVNGQPVKEKALVEGDIIEVSKYAFMYVNPAS